ncbi:hypothetical protein ACFRCG_04005 [Embleya sp. NPDC056575]|uniref:hypothetical protein n=1 Tax=unclassified Embleya TaxID=2699296 RepID=UPI0036B220B4
MPVGRGSSCRLARCDPAGAGSARAAGGSYIATYRYLSECQNTGAMYVHYAGASTYHCTGNGAVGFSLYVEYWA